MYKYIHGEMTEKARSVYECIISHLSWRACSKMSIARSAHQQARKFAIQTKGKGRVVNRFAGIPAEKECSKGERTKNTFIARYNETLRVLAYTNYSE
jgi:hypothetical protein